MNCRCQNQGERRKLDTFGIRCPKCGSKTRTMIREHTILEDFPLFCPKCRYTCVIRFMDGKLEEIKQPDAKTQS